MFSRMLFFLCTFLLLSTSVFAYHSASPFNSYQQNKLEITGDGIAKNTTYTVKDLEEIKDGQVTETYTMRTLVEAHNNKFSGITLESLLKKLEIKSEAKSIQFICQDGTSMKFSIDEIVNKTYINEVNSSKLKAILAFAKDGKALVPDKTSNGYDKSVDNSGGPIRLVIGQTAKNERNSPKFLQNVVKILVSTKEVGEQFSDIGSFYSWAEEAIYSLCEKKIMSGEGGGKFVPEKEVTRAEFAKILVTAFDLPVADKLKNSFKDVTKDNKYAPYIEAVAAKGLMQGTGGSNFSPEIKLTRIQIASIVIKAMGKDKLAATKNRSQLTYKDKDKIPDWACGSVAVANELKLFDNIAVGYFNANSTVNKAEVAVIIYKVLNIKK